MNLRERFDSALRNTMGPGTAGANLGARRPAPSVPAPTLRGLEEGVASPFDYSPAESALPVASPAAPTTARSFFRKNMYVIFAIAGLVVAGVVFFAIMRSRKKNAKSDDESDSSRPGGAPNPLAHLPYGSAAPEGRPSGEGSEAYPYDPRYAGADVRHLEAARLHEAARYQEAARHPDAARHQEAVRHPPSVGRQPVYPQTPPSRVAGHEAAEHVAAGRSEDHASHMGREGPSLRGMEAPMTMRGATMDAPQLTGFSAQPQQQEHDGAPTAHEPRIEPHPAPASPTGDPNFTKL